ncbi:HEAT repeat domain-containing protein [Streptomyces sp. NRRL WC-3742]|uniref:HEAT repeat domain-containing protein n=1 Tax=Streptomyces sp. NRRL WC-3742 TaxID=1463934 RepID=UPI0004C97492|nr:HEAT repeat domain-containing protein [Streptomyces sp. NRRL WC-3742]
MNLPPLLTAIEQADEPAALDLLLDAVPDHDLEGEDGSTLLHAAAHAGLPELVWALVTHGADIARPWPDGTDPVTWAAERGAYEILYSLLAPSPRSGADTYRRALAIAQAHLDAQAAQAAQAATGPNPPAHLAIVTDLEARLGVHRTPDELLARALVHALPEHDDWFASVLQLTFRGGQETFDWARATASDPVSLDRRRFGLDVINTLSFGLDDDDTAENNENNENNESNEDDEADEADEEPPYTAEALAFLRPLLDPDHGEQDPHALRTAIAAFASYCRPDELPAVLPHAGHPAPAVRRSVAMAFVTGATVPHPEVLPTLTRLAADPDPEVRDAAAHALTRQPTDSPELREALAAALTDACPDARLEAAAALALRGDDRGPAVLEEIRSALTGPRSRTASRLDEIDRLLSARHPTTAAHTA